MSSEQRRILRKCLVQFELGGAVILLGLLMMPLVKLIGLVIVLIGVPLTLSGLPTILTACWVMSREPTATPSTPIADKETK